MQSDYPGLFRVTNERKDGEKIGILADKELDWHSNGNGRKSGKECCVALYCVRPGENSVTQARDTRQAYRDLSEEDKEFYKQIDCTFKFENGTFYDPDEDDKELKYSQGGARDFKYGVTQVLGVYTSYDGDEGLYFTFITSETCG